MQQKIYLDYLHFLAEFDFRKNRVVILSGLPGSGKSTLGEILRDDMGYEYLSSDVARVKIMKLPKGKYATTSQYEQYQAMLYQYMRERAVRLIKEGGRVVLDATHLNVQRAVLLEYFRQEGIERELVRLIYVDGGRKEEIRKRFVNRKGKNKDGRGWVEAWETAYDYFVGKIESGEVKLPQNIEKGYPVVWVKNH